MTTGTVSTGWATRTGRYGAAESLLDALAPHWRQAASAGAGDTLRRLLAARDWAGLEALFRALLAGIPHDWHRRNDIARYEGYWASVFYAFFQASLDGVSVEDATSRGRMDLAVVSPGTAWLFEFKVAERAEAGAARAIEGTKLRRQAPSPHLIDQRRSARAFDVESA